MEGFKKGCIKLKVDKLFDSTSFSICSLDDIGEMVGVNPGKSEYYPYLRSLHCVAYSKMPSDVLEALPGICLAALKPSISSAGFAQALLAEGNDFTPTEDKFLNDTKKLN